MYYNKTHEKSRIYSVYHTKDKDFGKKDWKRLREFVTKNNRVIKLEVLIYQSVQSYRTKKK